MIRTLFALLVLVAAVPGSAETNADIAGIWEGTLDLGGPELRLVLHIDAGEDGSLTTTLDSPDQGATGMPTSGTTFENGHLVVEVASIGGRYEGDLGEDGVLHGTWSQGGRSLELDLARVDAPTERPRPQTPQEPFPYDVRDVRFSAGDHELAGTLTVPEGDGPFPAVVLVTGSGPQDRDESLLGHRPFWVLADHLSRRNVVVLRYDDRGTGESGGDFEGALTTDFAEDAAAALRHLRSLGDWAATGMIGHSEGALIAPILAKLEPELDFAVLMAGPSVSGRELMPEQSRLMTQSEGLAPQYLEAATEVNSAIFEAVAAAESEEAAKAAVKDILEDAATRYDEATQEAIGLDGTGEAMIDQVTGPWFRAFLAYDPYEDLDAMEMPVLALYGSLDMQVPAALNAPRMREALEDGDPRNEVVVLEGLNHLFQPAETGAFSEYARIETTLDVSFLDLVTAWIIGLDD